MIRPKAPIPSPAVPSALLGDIRALIDAARQRAVSAVNSELTMLYWRVGRRIHTQVLEGRRADYGEEVLPSLAAQRGVPTGIHLLPYPLGVQRLRHDTLATDGERQVQAALPLIDAIEALGITPIDVSPAYWRTLGNRLSARLALPQYTAERHAAWLAERELQ